MKRIALRRWSLAVALGALVWSGLLVLDTHIALASDQDGIAGYSMKLKDKNFDGSEGVLGENLGILEYSPRTGVTELETTLQVRATSEPKATLLRAYFRWLARWSW